MFQGPRFPIVDVPGGLSGARVVLGGGVELPNLNTFQGGGFGVTLVSRRPEPGWRSSPDNTVLGITPEDPSSFAQVPLTVRMPVDAEAFTPEQRAKARVVRVEPQGFVTVSSNVTGGFVEFKTERLGTFMVVAPDFANPRLLADEDAEVISNDPSVFATPVSPDADPVALMKAQGLSPVSAIRFIGPEGTKFSPAAAVKMFFDPAALAAWGNTPASLLQFTADGRFQILPGQFRDQFSNAISGRVPALSSYFGVFAAAPPVPAPDRVPPLTELAFEGFNEAQPSGEILVTTATGLGLSARDPPHPLRLTSGVATTYFLVDTPFVSLTETPPQVFASTFTLAAGTHALTFFSADFAGNVEAPNQALLNVHPGPLGGGVNPPASLAVTGRSFGTLELAWDANGNPPRTPYIVEYGTAPSDGSCNLGAFVAQTVEVKETSTVISGLIPGGFYAVSVCNFAALGDTQCTFPVVAQTGQNGFEANPSFTTCTGGGPTGNTDGRGIGMDASGRIWEVVRDNDVFKLARYDLRPSLEAAVVLPNATEEGTWTVHFDTAGNVYAVGASTEGGVAVYKASPDAVLLATATFSVPGQQSIALDASGDLWITGGLIAGDPETVSLALWRYCFHDNSLARKGSYSRGGGCRSRWGRRCGSSWT